MIVRCENNLGQYLPASCHDAKAGYDEKTVFPLSIGKDYVVYALSTYLGHVWYHIWDENSDYYPGWAPSLLFEVVDHRLSQYWIAGTSGDSSVNTFLIGYREWVLDKSHIRNLFERGSEAGQIFKRYQNLMDLEFKSEKAET